MSIDDLCTSKSLILKYVNTKLCDSQLLVGWDISWSNLGQLRFCGVSCMTLTLVGKHEVHVWSFNVRADDFWFLYDHGQSKEGCVTNQNVYNNSRTHGPTQYGFKWLLSMPSLNPSWVACAFNCCLWPCVFATLFMIKYCGHIINEETNTKKTSRKLLWVHITFQPMVYNIGGLCCRLKYIHIGHKIMWMIDFQQSEI